MDQSPADRLEMDKWPYDVLFKFFLREKEGGMLDTYLLVCERWAEILESQAFWVAKCKFDGRHIPEQLMPANAAQYAPDRVDYRLIWRKNPYGRNLIKNDSGQEGFEHWEFYPPEWDAPQRMWTPNGNGGEMHPIEQNVNGETEDGTRIDTCFATTWFHCYKRQWVDLRWEGVEEWILRRIRPRIVVSECISARPDCGSRYSLTSSLTTIIGTRLDGRRDQRDIEDGDGGVWEKITQPYDNYPATVRFVRVSSFGFDMPAWAGFFGVKMAKASVTLEFQ